MGTQRYVSTGRDGRSETGAGEVVWAVPPPGEAARPGRPGLPSGPTAAEEAVLELRSPDGLLDDLGERIFVAEAVGEPLDEDDDPVARVRSARLVAETAWGDRAAARFALGCAEHAMGDQAEVALPHGRTIGSVLGDVRRALDESGTPSASLHWLGRFATLRRLRRDGVAVGDLAMLAAKEDEKSGLDVVDDPAWTGLAAIEEAVLACAEAYRYLSHPHERAREEAVDDEARERDRRPPSEVHVEETPWGWVALGTERIPAHRPAARSAQHAAERCRQAVADAAGAGPAGAEAARSERAWQGRLLASALEG